MNVIHIYIWTYSCISTINNESRTVDGNNLLLGLISRVNWKECLEEVGLGHGTSERRILIPTDDSSVFVMGAVVRSHSSVLAVQQTRLGSFTLNVIQENS